MNLDEVYTLKEAAELWGVSDSNLRNAINKFGRFNTQIAEGTIRKSAGTWIVTKKAMEEVFGQKNKEVKKMVEFINVGKWRNDDQINLVETGGNVYALHGWNGDSYTSCWRCLGENFEDASKEVYTLTPRYNELNENKFEIIGYEVERN